MELFQTSLDHQGHEETIDANELNVVNSMSSISFRKIIEEFLIEDEPTVTQHHIARMLLNQMSSKVGMNKHLDKAK